MAISDLFQFPHFLFIISGIVFLSIAILLIIIHKPKNWKILHQITASLGLFIILLGLIFLGGLYLSIIHGIIGLLSFIFLLINLILGLIAIRLKRKKMRKLHIWIGRIIYGITLLTMVLGIILFL